MIIDISSVVTAAESEADEVAVEVAAVDAVDAAVADASLEVKDALEEEAEVTVRRELVRGGKACQLWQTDPTPTPLAEHKQGFPWGVLLCNSIARLRVSRVNFNLQSILDAYKSGRSKGSKMLVPYIEPEQRV